MKKRASNTLSIFLEWHMLHSSDLTIYTLQLFWTCVCQSIYFICCCWMISLYHIYKNYSKTDGLCYSKKTTTRKVILNNILTIIIKFKDQLLVIFCCCWLLFTIFLLVFLLALHFYPLFIFQIGFGMFSCW